MTKGFTNHNTHDMQFINCLKYKMHICIEKTDIGELVYGSDVPWFEIIWRIHGESIRSKTIDLLNLIKPEFNNYHVIPQDVNDAVIEVYGVALKKEYNLLAKNKGWDEIEVNK